MGKKDREVLLAFKVLRDDWSWGGPFFTIQPVEVVRRDGRYYRAGCRTPLEQVFPTCAEALQFVLNRYKGEINSHLIQAQALAARMASLDVDYEHPDGGTFRLGYADNEPDDRPGFEACLVVARKEEGASWTA